MQQSNVRWLESAACNDRHKWKNQLIVCSTYIISLIILTFLTFFPMRLIKYWTTSLAKAICFSDWNSVSELLLVEPVCCKKRPKIVSDLLLIWGIRALWRFWMVPNWSCPFSVSQSINLPEFTKFVQLMNWQNNSCKCEYKIAQSISKRTTCT